MSETATPQQLIRYCNNPDPRCDHPRYPEGDPLEYCWSYALHLDGKPGYEDMSTICPGCDLWKPEQGSENGKEATEPPAQV